MLALQLVSYCEAEKGGRCRKFSHQMWVGVARDTCSDWRWPVDVCGVCVLRIAKELSQPGTVFSAFTLVFLAEESTP